MFHKKDARIGWVNMWIEGHMEIIHFLVSLVQQKHDPSEYGFCDIRCVVVISFKLKANG